MEIKGSVALVTGGAKGLGFGIAENLQQQGATVVIIDRDAEALAVLPSTIDQYNIDVTEVLEVKDCVASIVKEHGRIDILINNAGVIYSEPMLNITKYPNMMHDYEQFRKTISLNLDSVFIVTSAVVEQMALLRTKGVIVNISSISACGNEGQTAYSAAKAGVEAMTVTWSKELGKIGIRCNAIAPGFINTESTRNALNQSILDHIESNTPLKRLGEIAHVAQAIISTIVNDYMNGVILPVNGGYRI